MAHLKKPTKNRKRYTVDDKQCVVIQQVIEPAEIAAYTYCTVNMNTNLLRTFFYKIKEGV